MSVHQDVVAKMDKIARWTGVPQLVAGKPRIRNLRWLPLLPFAISFIASAYLFVVPRSPYFAIAAAVFPSCIVIAVRMLSVGPLRQGTDPDEREANLRRDAFLFSFYIVGAIQMVAVPLFLAFAVMQHWTSTVILVRIFVSFLNLYLLFLLLPTMYASCAAPVWRPEED